MVAGNVVVVVVVGLAAEPVAARPRHAAPSAKQITIARRAVRPVGYFSANVPLRSPDICLTPNTVRVSRILSFTGCVDDAARFKDSVKSTTQRIASRLGW